MREMPKGVHHHQHEKVGEVHMLEKLVKGQPKGESKIELQASSPQRDRLHAMGGRRNSGEGQKEFEEEVIFVKEVKCAEDGRKTAAVEKRKELTVVGFGGEVTPVENGKSIKSSASARERDSRESLALGGMFVLSKSRKQMWDRMKQMKKKVASTPPLVPAHVVQMKDYRPKGKTYRRGVNKKTAKMNLQYSLAKVKIIYCIMKSFYLPPTQESAL